jgi:hypothetical protein
MYRVFVGLLLTILIGVLGLIAIHIEVRGYVTDAMRRMSEKVDRILEEENLMRASWTHTLPGGKTITVTAEGDTVKDFEAKYNYLMGRFPPS